MCMPISVYLYLCMYVCICVYQCVCIYMYVYLCKYLCVYLCTCIYMCTHMYVCLYMCIYIRGYIHVYVSMCVSTYICVWICVCYNTLVLTVLLFNNVSHLVLILPKISHKSLPVRLYYCKFVSWLTSLPRETLPWSSYFCLLLHVFGLHPRVNLIRALSYLRLACLLSPVPLSPYSLPALPWTLDLIVTSKTRFFYLL